MTRSRLRNRYLKHPCKSNEIKYKKYRNFCVNLFKKEKRKYYANLDPKLIIDNKQFWKTVKPLFSEKIQDTRNIILIENENIITKNEDVVEIMNDFFANAVSDLNIQGYQTGQIDTNNDLNPIGEATNKFKDHPSILKIKENINIIEKFSFSETKEEEFKNEIKNLNSNKPTTFNNIPAKQLKYVRKV